MTKSPSSTPASSEAVANTAEITILDPLVHDNGEYHLATRNGAQAAKAGELEDQIHNVRWANYQISGVLEILRDSIHRDAIDENLNSREMIIGVAELYKKFREILDSFRAIFRHLSPLTIDTATNAPVLSSENADSIRTFLAKASHHLPTPNKQLASSRSAEFDLTPNHQLISLFEKIMEDHQILSNPRYLTRIFEIIHQYLSAVLNTTDWALQYTIQSTAAQVSSLRNAAENFHQQAESAETFDLAIDGETVALWESFLYEIELVFGEALVNIFDILGENVSWLLKELDVDSIRKVLRECHRDLKAIQEQREAKRVWNDQHELTRQKNVLARFLSPSQPNEDKTPFAVLNAKINDISTIITRLEATIAAKSNFPPRP
jgi:hypothetical protein